MNLTKNVYRINKTIRSEYYNSTCLLGRNDQRAVVHSSVHWKRDLPSCCILPKVILIWFCCWCCLEAVFVGNEGNGCDSSVYIPPAPGTSYVRAVHFDHSSFGSGMLPHRCLFFFARHLARRYIWFKAVHVDDSRFVPKWFVSHWSACRYNWVKPAETFAYTLQYVMGMNDRLCC